jgi:cardiolipin synthase
MNLQILAIIAAVFHVLGIASAVQAIMETRTPQGAVAWVLGLITFPYVAVPAYWVFGRSKFRGFVALRRAELVKTVPAARRYLNKLKTRQLIAFPDRQKELSIEKLAKLPFTLGNNVELLVDGQDTFDSIFEGIQRAERYILVQFYILRADTLGSRLKDRLAARARQGVRVYVLYDEVGSNDLPDAYLSAMTAAGIQARKFNTTQGRANRFQINFRNHRKIVVVDGKEAWVGGHNVGDEYLGQDPKSGPWRDTHVRVFGPVAQAIQLTFAEDWHWASGAMLDLEWIPTPCSSGKSIAALALPSGPADILETCTLFFIKAIQSAERRLWIASPYFVPDEQFITALQLAVLKGVDVRLIIPRKTDNTLVSLTHWAYITPLQHLGVKVYWYGKGFMHQKVVLIDDDYATVGTANFDNRSFRLNFEITAVVADQGFNGEVARMLEADFARSRLVTEADIRAKGPLFRFAVRAAQLTAPIQ